MEITLQRLAAQKEYEGLSLLELKKELLCFKKEGILFFKEDMCSLRPDDTFQLYFCQVPSKVSLEDAFPVPIRWLTVSRNALEVRAYIKRYFKKYYMKEMRECEVRKYNAARPYIGEKYVWYFKN